MNLSRVDKDRVQKAIIGREKVKRCKAWIINDKDNSQESPQYLGLGRN